MSVLNRRGFLTKAIATSAGSLLAGGLRADSHAAAPRRGNLRLAPFRFDVTPPVGHSCCGGWIKPIVGVDDPLEAIGFVLLGADEPIVICAVDWTGLLNEAHAEWRRALASAAGTTAERVAVQCLHQHNAPFACLEAERIVAAQGDLPHIVDVEFFRQCLERGQQAVNAAVKNSKPVTHVAHGQAKVDKVAGNRRVFRDPDGRVKAMRGSSCRNAELRALPEGLIDPWLKTVALYDNDKKLAACHYYATHPMSYYGDGRASSDFVGLARRQRQKDEPDCMHIYFTGCSANVAAGKYNDGSKPMRAILTRRVYEGIVQSEQDLQPVPINRVRWETADVLPTPQSDLSAVALEKQIANRANSVVQRNRPAYQLAWLRRLERKVPLLLSVLHVNDVSLLHMPSECFVQYQLRAQQMQPNRFVATAAHGDGGPWYVPVKEEYEKGGYEVSVALCDSTVDSMLTDGMRAVLTDD